MDAIKLPSIMDGADYQAIDQSVSNVYVRVFRLARAGVQIVGHEHPYSHISILCSGRAKVTVNGKDTIYDTSGAGTWPLKPVLVYIQNGLRHEITALTDDVVWCCIHALRDKETGDVIDPESIPDGVVPPEMQASLAPIVGK